MSDYTNILGFTDFTKPELTETIENNLVMFFDWNFVDKGAYTNIYKANTDFKSNNHSQLRLVNDPNYTNGRVWETFHKNIVWESGLSVNNKINISGVYVNNTFVSKNTVGTFGHTIDYTNGRVIFNSPLPASTPVNLEYSYKTISFDLARSSPFLKFLQPDFQDIGSNNFATNSGDWNILAGQRIQFPSVVLELSPSIRTMPYEIGSHTKTHLTDALIHIFSQSENIAKRMVDIFVNMEGQTIYLLKTDEIAKSGYYGLDYDGTIGANPKTYPDLVRDGNSEFIQYKTYFKDIQSSAYNWMNYSFRAWINPNVHHSVVRLTLETVKTIY